jgi:hypothetical protein
LVRRVPDCAINEKDFLVDLLPVSI